MRKTVLLLGLSASLSVSLMTVSAAMAQERAIDGTLGAVAGAVVLGPVGLLAGAVVGVTAGPSISSSWGLRHHHHYHHVSYGDRGRY